MSGDNFCDFLVSLFHDSGIPLAEVVRPVALLIRGERCPLLDEGIVGQIVCPPSSAPGNVVHEPPVSRIYLPEVAALPFLFF